MLIIGLECIGRTVENEFDVDDEMVNFQAKKAYQGVVTKYYTRTKRYRVESSCYQSSSSIDDNPPPIPSPILQLCSCGCGTESNDMVQCPGAVKILCTNKLTRQCERNWKKCIDCCKKNVTRHKIVKRPL